jgi:hypothetical protein
MTGKRFAGVCVAAFVVSQILEIVVHGFILAADYAPFYGTLLRPMQGSASWQMSLLPVAHLSYVIALVWVYDRIMDDGPAIAQGLRIGFVGFAMGQAPLWLLWWAEQPWPDSIVLKQLSLELLVALGIGVTIAGFAKPRPVSSVAVSAA